MNLIFDYSYWLLTLAVAVVASLSGLLWYCVKKGYGLAIAGGSSVIVALLVLILWPVSATAADHFLVGWGHLRGNVGHHCRVLLRSSQGGLQFLVTSSTRNGPFRNPPNIQVQLGRQPAYSYPFVKEPMVFSSPKFELTFFGFQIFARQGPYGRTPDGEGLGHYAITVPHWFILLFCIPFPLLWFRRIRRQRHRLRNNLCLTCGYDLRASPDRCPECGKHVTKPNQSKQAPEQKPSSEM